MKDFIKQVDNDMKKVDDLFNKSMKTISQTNEAKMRKLLERENALDKRAFETAVIALYDYRAYFEKSRLEASRKIVLEVDYAIDRLNKLIQEM